MGNIKMVRDRRYFQLLFGMLIMTGILSGCSSSHNQLRIRSNYQTLFEQQSAKDLDDATNPKALPEMTSEDRERLGDVNFSRGNLQMAFVQYQKSLKLSPDNTRVKYKRGMVFVLGGLNDDAVKEFRGILKEKSDHSLANEGLGLAFFQMKRYEDAERHFRKAIELDSTLWKAHNMLGAIYDHQEKHNEAIREYRSAIALRGSDGLLYNNLGVSYLLVGHYEEAIDSFREGIRREPSSRRLYNNLGLALAKLGRHEEALLAFMEHGSEAQAHNNLGCIYLQQGEKKKAIRCFEKALEISPAFYHRASKNLKKAKAANVYDVFSIKSDN